MLAIGTDVDPKAVYKARRGFRESLGNALGSGLEPALPSARHGRASSPDADSAGHRALRNAALGLLTIAVAAAGAGRLRDHFERATNMTDSMTALDYFSEVDAPEREAVLKAFYKRWKKDALVLDKWFSVQARSPVHGTAEFVTELTGHPQFSMKNPNRVRAVLGAFAGGNPVQFNAADGKGYKLLADTVLELDGFNSLMAARLLGNFEMWRRMEPKDRKPPAASFSGFPRRKIYRATSMKLPERC